MVAEPVATVFPDVFAATAREIPLAALLETLRDPPTRPSKKACELFLTARIGDHRTPDNALRNNDNVLELSAVTGDYDGELIPLPTARDRLEVQGVKAAFCTSPSHTPEKPRWRVVAPLSAPTTKEMHPRLIARLDAALGGILASESRTLSQSYFFGKVNGHEYEHAESAGRCLDLVDDLDDLIPPEAAHTGAGPANPEPDTELRNDLVTGAKGKIYPGLLKLTARFVMRGEKPADVIAALQGLLDQCEWKARDPKTWQKRYDGIPKMVASAAKKYADPREHVEHVEHDEVHDEHDVQQEERPSTAAPTNTEMEIATLFARRGTGQLLYVAGMDWYTNAGPRWQRDEKLARFTLANELCRMAGGTAKDTARARIETNKTAAAIVTIARPDLIAVPSEFDVVPYELNTPKGVIDLRYGKMRQRTASDLFMHCTAVVA